MEVNEDLRIIFKRTDGGCDIAKPGYVKDENGDRFMVDIETVVMHQFDDLRKMITPDETPTEAFNRLGEAFIQSLHPYRVTTLDKIPTDELRCFRNAWTDDFDTDTVDVCMIKAKDLHMTRVRKARDKKFIEMGFPYKLDSNLEAAIIPQDIRDKLKKLRDIPQKLDLSTVRTPEELDSVWPEGLKDGKL